MNTKGGSKKEQEQRNLRFYKLLGQNWDVIANGLLRGKGIQYEVPKEYQMNTKKPLILDWLLDYGRPSEISHVRSFGPVKMLCIYNALMSWIEQNPEESNKWKYKNEWEEFFITNPKAFQKPPKPTTPPKKKEEEKPVSVVMPKFNFYTKRSAETTGLGDVYITVNQRKDKKYLVSKLSFHFRKNLAKKFESEYIVFAPHGNRIYFKEEDATVGFKITGNKSKSSAAVTATIRPKDIPIFEPFCKKELNLKYDEIYKMYYVEIEEEE